MNKKSKWTPEEEKVLSDQITRNAHNITQAFKEAARILENRTEDACRGHWYDVMLKRKNPAVCFAVVGSKSRTTNKKVITKKDSISPEKVTSSWWKKFLKLLRC